MAMMFSGRQDVYLDVAERYERFIMLGVLKNGDRLPSVRVVAGELGVNPNTVQRAYCHLEEKGLIKLLPKKGAYVSYSPGGDCERKKTELRDCICRLKADGYSEEEILRAVKEVYSCD